MSRVSRGARVLAAVVLVLAAARGARATSVTSMDLPTLVRLSAAVVRGEVESIATAPDEGGRRIDTWVTLRVDEGLKGARDGDRLTLRLPGGAWGDRRSLVFGVPGFEVGEQVVVFASVTRGGWLTVTGLFQGKYRVEERGGGEKDAVPAGGGGAEVLGPAAAARRRQPLSDFLGEVRELARRHPGGAALPAAAAPPPQADTSQSFTFLIPYLPLRWFEPDTGLPIAVRYNPAGAPSFADGVRGGFVRSLANWTNVTGSQVVLADGGDTTQSCRVFFDGSVVSHGDPCGQMPLFDTATCSGVLAITGVSGFALENRTVNGVSFLRMTEADTVFNAGIDCFLGGDRRNYEEILTHELGHLIGLGHTCGDSFTPACVPGTEADDALMAAFAHGGGRGGAPRTSDIDGARFIYPPEGFVDLKLNAGSFSTGQQLRLTADFNGTAAADVYLPIVRPDGTFVSLAPGFPVGVLAPFASGVPLRFLKDVPLFSRTFAASQPPGTYQVVAFVVRAGADPYQAGNWLSYDVGGFTFAP
jgi:hypothetical protein